MRDAARAYRCRKDRRAWALAAVLVVALTVASHVFVRRGGRFPPLPAPRERGLSPRRLLPARGGPGREGSPAFRRAEEEEGGPAAPRRPAEFAPPTSVDPWDRPTSKPPVPRGPRRGERFLAYLPHSGFHNQRIELENAILLAYYTKRTLVVPPCFLGPPMPWLRYDRLYSRLTLQTKHGLEHCPYLPPKVDDPLCVNYTQWTQVSWESVFNFDNLRPYVDFVHRDDVREVWLKEHLNVASAEDITFVKDRTLYEYRIHDTPGDAARDAKYQKRLDVSDLLKVESPLLHFGSLFGSGRVTTETLEHSTFNQLIQATLVYSNPKLMAAADRIIGKLGGTGAYLGLHLRVGDGVFRSRKPRYIRTAVGKLNKLLLLEAGRKALAAAAPDQASDGSPLAGIDLHASFSGGRRGLPLAECLARAGEAAAQQGAGASGPRPSPVLFLATDAPDPRGDPAFQVLYSRWPCVFTLADFAGDFDDIKNEVNDFDSTGLAPYLIPMLDSVVAAKGRLFVGTLGSTFSLFVDRLHRVYNGIYANPREHAGPAARPA